MSYPRLLRWLAVAAVAEWLLGRTLSRSAIFMPKTPAILSAYQGMIDLGQLAANAAALLALAVMVWMAQALARNGQRALPVALMVLAMFSVAATLFAPPAGLLLAHHLVTLAALLILLPQAAHRSQGPAEAAARLLPAAAMLAAEVHQVAAVLPAILELGSPAGIGLGAFNAGEAFVVASGVAWGWWFRPRRSELWIWIAATLPAMALSALYLAAPAMSGVLAIWSLGLTLYLPWPLYTLSAWACGAAALTALKRRHPAGLTVLLIVAGGYAPQMSSQLFLGLIALCLLGVRGFRVDIREHDRVEALPARTEPVALSLKG